MNYNNPQLISALAAEYVLGTLRGKARDRFEKLKFANETILQEVSYWESKLNGLSLELEAVAPEALVWERIQEKLSFTNNNNELRKDMESKEPNKVIDVDFKGAKNRAWQWTSGLAIAASLMLAVLLVNNITSVKDVQVQSVAVVTNEDAKLMWSFSILEDEIEVRRSTLVPRLANNDYQLWIVPASGAAPISIGVMQQIKNLKLQKPEIFDNIEIAALAVSKEPLGGSPTGAPTEVLYAAELATL